MRALHVATLCALSALLACSSEDDPREASASSSTGTGATGQGGAGAAGSGSGAASTGGSGAKGATSGGGEGGAGAASGAGGAGGGGAGGPCGDLTYQGKCEGQVLSWCERKMIKTADCAAMGQTCAWVDDTIGYDCVGTGFGYPVGNLTTYPAGGWTVTQVLGHYLNWNGFVGGHLAQDIATGEAATANAPVHSIGDGTVLYAGPNGSSYVNVVLVRHDLGGGQAVCSFYGHLGSVTVVEGQAVARGDRIATVLDWQAHFGAANSHLHYVVLSDALCSASDAAAGALICGYDQTSGPNGIEDLSSEPYVYTSVGDACGDQNYPDAFISPSQFIEANHF